MAIKEVSLRRREHCAFQIPKSASPHLNEETTRQTERTSTRVKEEDLIKPYRNNRRRYIRQRRQSRIPSSSRLSPIYRHRSQPSPYIPSAIRRQTIRCVTPYGYGVREADGVRDGGWGSEEVGGVEAGPDGEGEKEVDEEFVGEDDGEGRGGGGGVKGEDTGWAAWGELDGGEGAGCFES